MMEAPTNVPICLCVFFKKPIEPYKAIVPINRGRNVDRVLVYRKRRLEKGARAETSYHTTLRLSTK